MLKHPGPHRGNIIRMDIRIFAFIRVSIVIQSAFQTQNPVQSMKKPDRIGFGEFIGRSVIDLGNDEILEMLEERLCPQDQAFSGHQMEALDMHLFGKSLDIKDTHACAHLVIPSVDQRIF